MAPRYTPESRWAYSAVTSGYRPRTFAYRCRFCGGRYERLTPLPPGTFSCCGKKRCVDRRNAEAKAILVVGGFLLAMSQAMRQERTKSLWDQLF